MQVNEFGRVVALSEAAKQLLLRSFHVNLRALDAIVQSRRSGGTLRGFDEVSSQMRMWSRDLHAQLEMLGELSRDTIGQTSWLVKRERMVRLLGEAAQSSGNPNAQRAAEDGARAAQETREKLTKQWRKIRLALEDIDQLGMMACVLSRSAMIEASTGTPEQRQQLSQVSREFYRNSEEVVDIIKQLLKATREE